MAKKNNAKKYQREKPVRERQPKELDKEKMDARRIAGKWMGRRPEEGDHMDEVGDGRIL